LSLRDLVAGTQADPGPSAAVIAAALELAKGGGDR
ncbi:MAG: hypothetical protein RLZZ432_748, partial [Chloroflexota bacterium]